jgi:hypothetical protein
MRSHTLIASGKLFAEIILGDASLINERAVLKMVFEPSKKRLSHTRSVIVDGNGGMENAQTNHLRVTLVSISIAMLESLNVSAATPRFPALR